LLNNRFRTRPNQTSFRFAPRAKRLGVKRLAPTQKGSENGWFLTAISDPYPFTPKSDTFSFCTANETSRDQTTCANKKKLVFIAHISKKWWVG
jgi:hypothetical protein